MAKATVEKGKLVEEGLILLCLLEPRCDCELLRLELYSPKDSFPFSEQLSSCEPAARAAAPNRRGRAGAAHAR